MMRVSATAKYLRHSTRKTRLVTQAIVGLPVAEAAAVAASSCRRRRRVTWPRCSTAPPPTPRTTTTCRPTSWSSREATADEGPTIKRFRPRAQGRAFAIHKPMTHITVVVENREA